jgi:hypothetical protein
MYKVNQYQSSLILAAAVAAAGLRAAASHEPRSWRASLLSIAGMSNLQGQRLAYRTYGGLSAQGQRACRNWRATHPG